MIDDYEKKLLSFTSIVDRDDNGKTYSKSFYYMDKSVRISIKTQMRLLNYSKSAQLVYWHIINQLNKNEYEITVTRSVLKSVTGLSDASVSRAIEELSHKPDVGKDAAPGDEIPLIQIIDKDTYRIPIHQCVKGNVNTIIEREKKMKEEMAVIEKEKAAREEITQFSIKLRNKKK